VRGDITHISFSSPSALKLLVWAAGHGPPEKDKDTKESDK